MPADRMRLVLVGGGGHASDVLGVVEDLADSGVQIDAVGLLDDTAVSMRRFEGRGIKQIGAVGDLRSTDATHYIIAVGWPAGRKAVADLIAGSSIALARLIHTSARLGRGVEVGDGTVVFDGVHVSAMASIGAHVLLSYGALIGHDCHVGDFTSVMPGAVVSGDIALGEGCTIGTNASIIQGVSIGPWATVGAGAVVTKDVPAGATVVGAPARPLRRS